MIDRIGHHNRAFERREGVLDQVRQGVARRHDRIGPGKMAFKIPAEALLQ
jgi:hypothetical protein